MMRSASGFAQGLRRDPRTERRRGAINPHTGRLRICRDPNAVVTAASSAAPAAPRPVPEKPLVRIDDPAYLVFSVPDFADRGLSVHDREMLGVARALADEGGGAVCVLCFGKPRDNPADAGADRLLTLLCPEAGEYAPDVRAAAIRTASAALQPRHLVFPDSDEQGADLGRRTAALMQETIASSVWKVDLQHCSRSAVGGGEHVTMPTPFVVLVAPETGEPVADRRCEARAINVPTVDMPDSAVMDAAMQPLDPAQLMLDEAEFIVSAGNGVRNWDDYHALAAALAATEGGTRVVVDDGHLPPEKQVGATGTITNARTYLALGISGAPQHLQGISNCENVVAVNTDAACDMMKRADLAVVGDVQAVMRSLLKLAQGNDEAD